MPACRKVLEDFLVKKTYDFGRSDIDLYNFHPQFRVFFALNGVFFINRTNLLRIIWPAICLASSAAGLALDVVNVTHFLSIKDYEAATESFCYAMILGTVPVVYLSVGYNKDLIYELVERINTEFVHICGLGPRYRKPFLKGQLLIWQLCAAWFAFMVFLVCAPYALWPAAVILYQALFATQDEHMSRPLQFPIYLPHDDAYRTPNYEMLFALEVFLILAFMQTFCTYVYSFFHVLLHYHAIIDMIILQLGVIFEGLDESVAKLPRYDRRRMETQHVLNERVGHIAKLHLAVFEAIRIVSSVYGPVLVYQVMVSPIIICLIMFQIAENLARGTIHILFCILVSSSIVQLWIPCYLGTKVRNKAFEVGDACWNCGWHLTSLGRMVRNDFALIIMRAQQPVTIKFFGVPPVQLETFSLLMSKSYSYFNMLRQYSMKHGK